MIKEYNSIIKNYVWEIVPRPKGNTVLTFKWLYKIKHVFDDNIEKYKERFVAQVFSQKEGIDYDETFDPVVIYTNIKTIFSLTFIFGWKLHQMDLKIDFLNGKVEE